MIRKLQLLLLMTCLITVQALIVALCFVPTSYIGTISTRSVDSLCVATCNNPPATVRRITALVRYLVTYRTLFAQQSFDSDRSDPALPTEKVALAPTRARWLMKRALLI